MKENTVSLKKNYRYLCLDLETSGLDKEKDHIIQIGIIALNETGQIYDHFSSYINPGEENIQLNDIVSHLTNIRPEDLAAAPALSSIEAQVANYFGDDVILIGHNISFDQGFLEKHMPSLSWHRSIDTFDISGSSIPYLKSYALENIHAHLLHQENYADLYTRAKEKVFGPDNEGKSHDALYDSLLCLCLIQRWLHYVSVLIEKYSYLGLSYEKVDKNEGYLSINTNYDNNDIILEAIERPLVKNTKKSNTQKELKEVFGGQGNKISMKGLSIRELIDQLPEPSLIAVSHPSKIEIIKNACPDYHFDYLKDDQVINFSLYQKRIQKDSLSMNERLFCILYSSHASLGYSVLQPILPLHKHILSYITDKNIAKSYHNHILCTHGGWYAYREQYPDRSDKLSHYTICMLDIDRWYITYNDYASRYFNPQSLLFPRDEFLYQRRNDNLLSHNTERDLTDYEKIYSDILMFVGLFYIESNSIHTQSKSQQREVICYESAKYERSIALRQSVYQSWQSIATIDEKSSYLGKRMEKMNKLLSQETRIQYTQSSGKEGYYTLTPIHRYIDFSEYNDLFEKHNYCFFSPHRGEYTALSSTKEQTKNVRIKNINSLSLLDQELYTSSGKNIFIISHNSEKSKQLFKHIRMQSYIHDKEILAEYITGGIQKNVAKSNRTNEKSLLMIGGYHYLLNTWGSKVTIDTVIIYHIPKAWESFIHDDIMRYASV